MVDELLNGKYRLIRQMAAGGMGAVFEAEEVPGGGRVAIKVISTGDENRDRALVTRFHREAKATMSIDTENIVRVFETGNDAASGQPFMVMEYLTGEDLAGTFQRLGPLPPDAALRITAQACLGLDKAHAARVVHRDIKPANLFLAEREGGDLLVKILDFGIAKIKMDQADITDSKSLTRTGSMMGSPLYMSPEQARGSKSIDHRADIWSLGVVLYQALTGRTPNQDIDALGELIIAICSELPRPVQELAPWVPKEVAAIVHRALRFEPADRFQTAGEMLAALRPLLPGGSALTPAQLVPLTAEARAVRAPLLEATPPPTRLPLPSHALYSRDAADPSLASTTAEPEYEAPRVSSPPSRSGAPASAAPLSSPAKTSAGLAASRGAPAAAPSSGRSAVIGMLAGVVALGAAFGVYKAVGGAPPGTSAPLPPPATATVAATPTLAPTVPAAPAAPGAKTVRVGILPLDATVDVDGEKAPVTEGGVEIAGGLGTVHRVHITKGQDQLTEDVAVTQQGAVPSKLELKPLPSKKPLNGAP